MIKTTRSRLEIRQDPDRLSTIAGLVLVAFGGLEAVFSLLALMNEWLTPLGKGYLISTIRLISALAFTTSGWFFLRGRSRIVFDLEHRMIARYMGVGGESGGNRSWDLQEFNGVECTTCRRSFFRWFTEEVDRISLSRPDGTRLDIYWSRNSAREIAQKISQFTGLFLVKAQNKR